MLRPLIGLYRFILGIIRVGWPPILEWLRANLLARGMAWLKCGTGLMITNFWKRG